MMALIGDARGERAKKTSVRWVTGASGCLFASGRHECRRELYDYGRGDIRSAVAFVIGATNSGWPVAAPFPSGGRAKLISAHLAPPGMACMVIMVSGSSPVVRL